MDLQKLKYFCMGTYCTISAFLKYSMFGPRWGIDRIQVILHGPPPKAAAALVAVDQSILG